MVAKADHWRLEVVRQKLDSYKAVGERSGAHGTAGGRADPQS